MNDNGKIIVELDEDEVYAEENRNTVRMLSFSLGREHYCVDIKDTKEVISMNAVTYVPGAPAFVKGVINLRGEILAVINMGHFFGLEETERQKEAMVIITDVHGFPAGVIIDRVTGTN